MIKIAKYKYYGTDASAGRYGVNSSTVWGPLEVSQSNLRKKWKNIGHPHGFPQQLHH